MKIYINDQSISFELDEEKSLSAVLQELAKYANEQRAVLHDLEVNGEAFPADGSCPPEKNLEIEKVKEIRSQLTPPVLFTTTLLAELNDHLLAFKEGISEKDLQKNFSAMNEKLRWMETVLEKSGTILSMQNDFASLISTLTEIRLMLFRNYQDHLEWPVEKASRVVEGFSRQFRNLELKLSKKDCEEVLLRLEEQNKKNVENTSEEIEACFSLLKNLGRKTLLASDEASRLFQVGKTIEALGMTVDLVDSLDIIMRGKTYLKKLYEKMGKEKKSTDEPSSIENILSELEEALKKKDFVELADLIEYELAPELKKAFDS